MVRGLLPVSTVTAILLAFTGTSTATTTGDESPLFGVQRHRHQQQPLQAQNPTTSEDGADTKPVSPQWHSQNYKFDPLMHLPGISPYFDAIGFGLEHRAPLGCKVEAATYLIRHGAIYANDADYEKYIEPFIAKLNTTYGQNGGNWTGPMSFIEDWVNPINDPENQMEQITPSGIQDSVRVGRHLLSRYPDLVPTTKKIYTDKKDRTKDSAKAFVRAFPQENVEIVEISTEDEFHAQIPHKSCEKFTKAAGDNEFGNYTELYTKSIVARLQPYSPVELGMSDIVGMIQLCGYESAITGGVSLFCDMFTDYEILQYEYSMDVKYQYMVGHGNPLSPYLGFPWLNQTAKLFAKIPSIPVPPPGQTQHSDSIGDNADQRFFLSFTHREVPPFIATALGLFNSSSSTKEDMPIDAINFARSWKMSELVPFLGHIGVEKLVCNDVVSGAKGKHFVRVLANSAPRPIPACQSGPGGSCAFEDFEKLVQDGMDTYGDFHKVCGKKTKKEKGGIGGGKDKKGKKDKKKKGDEGKSAGYDAWRFMGDW